MTQKKKVFIALGANVGKVDQNIEKAIQKLNLILDDLQISELIRTKPVGYTDQPDFLNGVVSGFTDMEPEELLKTLKILEGEVGRKKRFRWGPREIDLDIIFYGDLIYKSKTLEIPHPRAVERDFVLKPILELDKEIIFPGKNKKVSQILKTII